MSGIIEVQAPDKTIIEFPSHDPAPTSPVPMSRYSDCKIFSVIERVSAGSSTIGYCLRITSSITCGDVPSGNSIIVSQSRSAGKAYGIRS